MLRRIWAKVLMPWRDRSMLRRNEALVQLLDQRAEQELLAEALRKVVSGTAQNLVMIVDEGYDPDAPDDAPGWTFMETDGGDNAQCGPAGAARKIGHTGSARDDAGLKTAGTASRRALDAGLAALPGRQLAGLRPRMAAAAPGTLP